MTATELRGIRGELNRKEFASLLGWKAGTLANYENGNPIPDDRAAHVRLFVKYQDALKAIRAIKWDFDGILLCPDCEVSKGYGTSIQEWEHKEDCLIGKVLKEGENV